MALRTTERGISAESKPAMPFAVVLRRLGVLVFDIHGADRGLRAGLYLYAEQARREGWVIDDAIITLAPHVQLARLAAITGLSKQQVLKKATRLLAQEILSEGWLLDDATFKGAFGDSEKDWVVDGIPVTLAILEPNSRRSSEGWVLPDAYARRVAEKNNIIGPQLARSSNRDYLGSLLDRFMQNRSVTENGQEGGQTATQGLGEIDLSEARRLYAEARKLGFTFDSALKTLQAAAEAAHATTARAKATPRVKKANPELTAARLLAAYETLKRSSDLDNPKLSVTELRQRANHLLKTYERLRKHDPGFHDDSDTLRGARHIMNQKNSQRRKAKKTAKATTLAVKPSAG